MRRSLITTALLTAIGALPAAAVAGPLVVGSSGSWQSTQSASAEAGNGVSPYWNGPSWDSTGPCNAGSLVGGTACNGHVYDNVTLGVTANGAANYWGTAGGGADADFYLEAGASATYELTMHAELTAWHHNNEVGWYDPLTGEHHAIFSADMSAGDSVQVELPSVFGFYYKNTEYDQAYYTQSSLNDGGMLGGGIYSPSQQFALFNEGDYWWLAIEDLFGPLAGPGGCGFGLCSDWDYNDMIIGFRQISQVPEPGMTSLLGLGLLGVAWVARRRSSAWRS